MAAYTTVYTDFTTGNKLSVTVTYQNGDYTTQVTGQFDQRCDVVQYDAGQLKGVIESTYMLAVNSVTGSPPSASVTQAYVNQAYADAYAACAIGDAEGLDLSSVTVSIGGDGHELHFGNGITDNELWFRQLGNYLQIDLLGTSSEVTVSGWFASTNNQLQEITASGLKLDTQVSQLVQALAIYSAANAGFDPTQAAQMPSNSGLQSAVAATWHH